MLLSYKKPTFSRYQTLSLTVSAKHWFLPCTIRYDTSIANTERCSNAYCVQLCVTVWPAWCRIQQVC